MTSRGVGVCTSKRLCAHLARSLTHELPLVLERQATSFNPTVLEIPGSLDYNPPNYYFAVGILYGIGGALMATYFVAVQLLVMGVFRPVKRICRRVAGPRGGRVVVAVLGGTMYGVAGWMLPLTMGDGSVPLIAPVTYANKMDTSVMAVSCFVNVVCFWVSMETGFVGGIFTPLIYTGSLLGGVFSNVAQINTQVARSCGFISLAAALIPAPITLCFFAASIFRLGAPYLFPLMTCAFTSHILFDATGAAKHLTRTLRAHRLGIKIRSVAGKRKNGNKQNVNWVEANGANNDKEYS